MPTSVQLVVSATSSLGHVQAALEQFSPLQPTGLVITKLDEANGFGAWLSILQQCDLAVSYVTHGQHVPRDISAANRRRLASFLLGHVNQSVA
jgi:flagellar biosynthesis protein FlhF